MSVVAAGFFFFAVALYLRRPKGQRFYLVPSPGMAALRRYPTSTGGCCAKPKLPADPAPVLIADLRAELERGMGAADRRRRARRPSGLSSQAGPGIDHRPGRDRASVRKPFRLAAAQSQLSQDQAAARFLRRLVRCRSCSSRAWSIALLIKLESPGPVFFRQKRRGYRGNEFRVVKFRTMVHRPGRDAPCDQGRGDHPRSRQPGHPRSAASCAAPGSTSCRRSGTSCAAR